MFPLLKKEIVGEGNFGGDYVKNLAYLIVILKNKSLLIAGNSLKDNQQRIKSFNDYPEGVNLNKLK